MPASSTSAGAPEPRLGLVVLTMLLAACVGSPTSTPSTSSASIAASPGPPRTPVPTLAFPTSLPASATLAVDSWAKVVVDRLNIRERAGTDAPSLGLLPTGSAGMIAAGPVEADGYDWYALAAPGLPYASGCATNQDPSILDCPIWFGWVASSDGQGNPWIVPAELECPAAPTTIAQVTGIQPGVRLACFGSRPLDFAGMIDLIPGDGYYPFAWEPRWLADPLDAFGLGVEDPTHSFYSPTTPWPFLPLRFPNGPYAGWERGDLVQIRGHFDDPAATTCHISPPDFPGSVPDPNFLVFSCRERFVVEQVTVTGHYDLPDQDQYSP